MKFQKEGTLLGFILGLVVGLGLALAVAVYVTKVPVPFLSKGQNRTPEQDAAEARKNKDWSKADSIRKEIEAGGFAVEDTPLGSVVKACA